MEMDREKLTLKSLKGRHSKVGEDLLAGQWSCDTPLFQFIDALPDILAVREMRLLAGSIHRSRLEQGTRLLMYGGHVIKCGLGPLLVRWLEEGIFNALATNGSGSIHDLEMALYGETSEDVQAGLKDGSFGMWEETSRHYASAVRRGSGLGRDVGLEILENRGRREISPLAAAAELGVPATVHPSLGADIVHPIAGLDWSLLGGEAEKDFDLFCGTVGTLADGVVLNAGSAVVMPEVFLKALSTARNLGFPVRNITAANFDMIRQYRSMQNVVLRPVRALGGTSLSVTGHHELMLPLLDAFIRREERG